MSFNVPEFLFLLYKRYYVSNKTVNTIINIKCSLPNYQVWLFLGRNLIHFGQETELALGLKGKMSALKGTKY